MKKKTHFHFPLTTFPPKFARFFSRGFFKPKHQTLNSHQLVSTMAASEGTQTSLESEVVNEQETLKVEETLGSTEAQRVSESQFSVEESSGANAEVSSPLDTEEGSGKTLEQASEFMEKGSLAMKAGDFAEAADCFSRAVEIRVGHYGELSPECSSAYYKYGCALLYKAQEEADPLGSVPKKEINSQQNAAKDGHVSKGECSTAAVSGDVKKDGDPGQQDGEPNDGSGKKDQVEEDDGGDDGEESEGDDVNEQDEDESDLDLAWKMLDLARAIVEKNTEDTIEKVDILSALGEVALEREDIETSLSDYSNALSILERMSEPDSRHIAELNFRMCLVLEVGSKPEEALPYCEKAISICKARVQRLMDEMKNSTISTPADGNQQVDQPQGGPDSDSSIVSKEAEIKTLTSLSSDLEKKLEDLQQLVLHPTSIMPEVFQILAAKVAGNGKSPAASALSSSQMATNNGGGCFDSPTLSTVHTNGSIDGVVKDLGVVGRGVKRVSVSSSNAESNPAKKPLVEKGEGSS